jgi:hypothetical protein
VFGVIGDGVVGKDIVTGLESGGVGGGIGKSVIDGADPGVGGEVGEDVLVTGGAEEGGDSHAAVGKNGDAAGEGFEGGGESGGFVAELDGKKDEGGVLDEVAVGGVIEVVEEFEGIDFFRSGSVEGFEEGEASDAEEFAGDASGEGEDEVFIALDVAGADDAVAPGVRDGLIPMGIDFPIELTESAGGDAEGVQGFGLGGGDEERFEAGGGLKKEGEFADEAVLAEKHGADLAAADGEKADPVEKDEPPEIVGGLADDPVAAEKEKVVAEEVEDGEEEAEEDPLILGFEEREALFEGFVAGGVESEAGGEGAGEPVGELFEVAAGAAFPTADVVVAEEGDAGGGERDGGEPGEKEAGPGRGDGGVGVAVEAKLALGDTFGRPEGGVEAEGFEEPGEGVGIALGEDHGGIVDDLGDGTAGGADGGDAAGHGLDEDVAELFFPDVCAAVFLFGGQDEDIEHLHERGDVGVFAGGEEVEPGTCCLEGAEFGGEGAVADEGEGEVEAGVAGADRFGGGEEIADAFERFEPAAEPDDE